MGGPGGVGPAVTLDEAGDITGGGAGGAGGVDVVSAGAGGAAGGGEKGAGKHQSGMSESSIDSSSHGISVMSMLAPSPGSSPRVLIKSSLHSRNLKNRR